MHYQCFPSWPYLIYQINQCVIWPMYPFTQSRPLLLQLAYNMYPFPLPRLSELRSIYSKKRAEIAKSHKKAASTQRLDSTVRVQLVTYTCCTSDRALCQHQPFGVRRLHESSHKSGKSKSRRRSLGFSASSESTRRMRQMALKTKRYVATGTRNNGGQY